MDHSLVLARIPGFTNYLAGSDGFIWSLQNCFGKLNGNAPRRLIGKHDKDGYHSMILVENGKRISVRAHRLIAIAFWGESPPDAPYALHRDDNKNNNSPDNLYWGTQKQNLADQLANGCRAGMKA